MTMTMTTTTMPVAEVINHGKLAVDDTVATNK